MRGETGRFFLLALAVWACAAVVFFAGGFPAAVAFGFALMDLGVPDDCKGDCEAFACAEGAAEDCVEDVCAEEDGPEESCRGTARAAECTPFRSPQSTASASTHHHLRPNRTTLFFLCANRNSAYLEIKSIPRT
jgi:hypothetical protein